MPAPTSAIFALPSSLTIDNVVETKAAMEALTAGTEAVTLDAGATEVITTAGVQLLLALERSLEQSGRSLALLNAREPFKTTLRTLGLSANLSKWEQANA